MGGGVNKKERGKGEEKTNREGRREDEGEKRHEEWNEEIVKER